MKTRKFTIGSIEIVIRSKKDKQIDLEFLDSIIKIKEEFPKISPETFRRIAKIYPSYHEFWNTEVGKKIVANLEEEPRQEKYTIHPNSVYWQTTPGKRLQAKLNNLGYVKDSPIPGSIIKDIMDEYNKNYFVGEPFLFRPKKKDTE